MKIQKGLANLQLVIIMVILIGVVSFAGLLVAQNQNSSNSTEIIGLANLGSVKTTLNDALKAQAEKEDKTAEPEEKPNEPSKEPAPTKPENNVKTSCGTIDETTAELNSSLSKYGLTASTNLPDYPYLTEIASSDNCAYESYADLFVKEFKKMPTSLIKATGADILIASKIINSSYEVAAMPMGSLNAVTYDIDGAGGGNDYMGHVVIHEYLHQIDYVLFGSFYYTKSSWTGCNPSGFSYGAGGIDAYSGNFSNGFHPSDGFVTGYSKYGEEEDRAEVFTYMMRQKSLLNNSVDSKDDSNLQCKIDAMEDKIQIHAPSYSY